MIPLAVPNLAGREGEYLQECITSTFVSSVGPFVDRFEDDVASAAGTDGAIAVSSGTAGLHVALRAAGVGIGDLVALPSFTFIASANAISYCGATPWLFDVVPTSWTLDPEQFGATLKQRLTPAVGGPVDRATGRRLAAVLPVHTLGHPADLDPITETADMFDVPVIADAAAALGSTYRGRPIGRAGAVMSVFSFNGNKTVTAGGGGAVASEDTDLIERMRHLSTTARLGPGYDHDTIGFNYRMTNVQAAVGCAQLEQLDTFIAAKHRIRETYREHLSELPGVQAFPVDPWVESACWFSGLVFDRGAGDRIDEVRQKLRALGVDARPFWTPMHRQAPYASAPAEPQPVTDDVWQRILPLPCSTGITDSELERVIDAVRQSIVT